MGAPTRKDAEKTTLLFKWAARDTSLYFKNLSCRLLIIKTGF